MDIYKELTTVLVKSFNLIGIDPFNKMHIVYMYVGMVSITIISILNVINLINVVHDFKLLIDSIASLCLCFHTVIKCYALVLKWKQVKGVFEKTRQFYSIEDFDTDFRLKCRAQINSLTFMVKVFKNFCTSGLILVTILPLFTGILTIKCYIPSWVNDTVFAAFNLLGFAYGAMTVICFDAFTCVMITFLYLQFKMLNVKISSLNLSSSETGNENLLLQIKSLVEYQNFLFSFLQDLSSIISTPFLFHFIVSNFSILFELYLLITDSSHNLMDTVRHVMFLIGLATEVMIYYCIPSTLLTDEASKTLNALYSLKWYECKSMSVRKMIVIMMQRVQRDAVISASGVFVVNMETGTQYFKTSFSFFTSLKAMGD